MAEGVLEARGTGVYSLISSQPLRSSGGNEFPGQPLTAAHVAWLSEHEMWANLAELTTLKSDDIENREALDAALKGDGRFPKPGIPESLSILQCALRTVGFYVEVRRRSHHVGLMLRPASDADAKALSSGVVRKPETVHYRTELPERAGLFCTEIFGQEDLDRRRRFGHIELAAPIVPYIWRAGKPSLVARMTGLLDSEDPAGAEAVEEALRQRGYASAVDGMVRRTVLVFPPDLRPLVKLESGNWATSDLNDLYRRLINRNNRLRKLIELKAPEQIITSERRMLQSAADALMANCILPKSVAEQFSDPEQKQRRLVDVLHQALDVAETSEKRVEYAGRAPVMVDRSLSGSEVRVPNYIIETVGLGKSAVLLAQPQGEPAGFASARPIGSDDVRIMVPPVIAERLGLSDGAPCVVHRPLSPAAIAEAERLVDHPMAMNLSQPVPDPPGDELMIDHLINCATNGIEWELSDPRGLLVSGAGETSLS